MDADFTNAITSLVYTGKLIFRVIDIILKSSIELIAIDLLGPEFNWIQIHGIPTISEWVYIEARHPSNLI